MTRFGERLKELREQRSLSVNQLAMYAGVSAAAISRIENGHRDDQKIGRGSENAVRAAHGYCRLYES